jgi:hypothetical protein
MRCKVLHAPRTHLQQTAIIRWTASQASHLVALMSPEMQPPPSTMSREVIIISVFVLVEGRKRRDSNPRYLSARSLSSRRGAVCRGMSQAVELRVFARSVWLNVGQTAVGCYTAATRRHPAHQPCGVVPKRRHGGPSRGRWRPAKAPVDRLAMGPGAVLTKPV